MHAQLLKSRPGFTLGEVIVALTMTAIIGAALTGVFATQMRFFDEQERTGSARAVSQGAMNIVLSELRMLELDSGLVSASAKKITIRVPYAMGMFCGLSSGQPVVSFIPTDTMMAREAGHTGYAYRTASTGRYTYVGSLRDTAAPSICTAAGVRTFVDSGGGVLRMATAPPLGSPDLVVGAPVMAYQRISYEFRTSVDVPGTIALWRTIEGRGEHEELVAPFDTSAGFRFFINDGAVPSATPPLLLNRVTGIQLLLDGAVEQAPGKSRKAPITTSVFFRNR